MKLQFDLARRTDFWSLPLWECGLKYNNYKYESWLEAVTPFMGVWIEICLTSMVYGYQHVTPFMGVWIEITCSTSGQ